MDCYILLTRLASYDQRGRLVSQEIIFNQGVFNVQEINISRNNFDFATILE